MSKKILENIFYELPQSDEWSFQLLKINNSIRKGTTYICREVNIQPETRLLDYVNYISEYYTSKGLTEICFVDDYTGDVVGNVVYKLPVNSDLITPEYDSLITATSDPDTESEISKRYSAYMIKCSVQIEGTNIPVKMFSMQSPVSYMTNKFLWFRGDTFREIKDPVLSLKKTVDAMIIGDTFYMFNMQAENLFNMERAYTTKCTELVEKISDCNFLTNDAAFRQIATTGHNPRRFVSYNSNRLDALMNIKKRRKLAEKFHIAMKGNLIDTEDANSSERLIKFLCNKGMLDPLDDSPVEVSAAKGWS